MFYRYLGHSGNDSPIAVMTWKLKSLQSYRFLTVGIKRKQKPSKFNNSGMYKNKVCCHSA